MGAIASQITSLTIVYSIVYSDADQRKHQSSASLAFVRGIHRDRWIPRTKGQLRGKCFHLITLSWNCPNYLGIFRFQEWKGQYKVMVVFVIVEKISQHLFLYITCYHSYRLHIIWHCEQTLIYNLLWQIYKGNLVKGKHSKVTWYIAECNFSFPHYHPLTPHSTKHWIKDINIPLLQNVIFCCLEIYFTSSHQTQIIPLTWNIVPVWPGNK